MSIRSFTKEEQAQLRENKYTYSVSANTISFTIEFKKEFWKRYQTGQRPRQIVQELADLNISSLHLEMDNPFVTLIGKGRKSRNVVVKI